MATQKLTIFHLAQLMGIVAGIAVGTQLGHRYLGLPGAFVGGAAGIALGIVVGRVPLIVATGWLRYDLKRSSNGRLRQRLETQNYISHIIIAELVARGEPVETFRDLIVSQIASRNPDVRRFGELNAKLWLPDLSKAKH